MKQNSKEIPADELFYLNSLIEKANWRVTKLYTGPMEHSYVVIKEYPLLVIALKAAIKEYGYDEKFGGKTYRYLWIGDYKYWNFITLVNREHKSKEEEREQSNDRFSE